MSAEAAAVICITILVILFHGTPDLMSALHGALACKP
jgi:hypothetical protein